MLVFVIRRLLISIPVLIASSMITFVISKLAGDPLLYLKQRQPRPPQSFIDSETHRLWLDRSWPAQYWHWISNIVLHWNWGQPLEGHGNVDGALFQAFGVTARLVVVAVVFALLLAMATGVVSAVRQYSAIDYTTTFLGFLFLSMPVFWFGILLKQLGIWINGHTGSRFLGTIGERSIPITDHSFGGTVYDVVGHLVCR